MKLNSGNRAPTACTTACAIAACAMGRRLAVGFWSVCLLSSAGFSADVDIAGTLKGIENHYNRAQTLKLSFVETSKLQGRQRVEKGDLFLRKPGRMRWQYTAPAGKLFVSDGKFIYSYTPQDNRAEKMK